MSVLRLALYGVLMVAVEAGTESSLENASAFNPPTSSSDADSIPIYSDNSELTLVGSLFFAAMAISWCLTKEPESSCEPVKPPIDSPEQVIDAIVLAMAQQKFAKVKPLVIQGQPNKAIETFTRAVDICDSISNPKLVAATLLVQARRFRGYAHKLATLDRVSEAVACYMMASVLYRKMSDDEQARAVLFDAVNLEEQRQ